MSEALIFIYGTFLRGERDHHLLKGAQLVAPLARTAPRYTLGSLGSFPAMLEGGRTSIAGEVYRMHEPVELAPDSFEGSSRFFVRKPIVLMYGPRDVEAFVWPSRETRGRLVIASGDWRARRAAPSPPSPLIEGLADLARGRTTAAAWNALMVMRRRRP